MAAANNSNGPLLEWYRLSDSTFDNGGINVLVVLALNSLDKAFPNRVDLLDQREISEHVDVLARIWDWLEQQDVLNGSLTNCSFTLLGQQSFKGALAERPDLATALRSAVGLTGNQASEMMMTFLRQHFHRYIEGKQER